MEKESIIIITASIIGGLLVVIFVLSLIIRNANLIHKKQIEDLKPNKFVKYNPQAGFNSRHFCEPIKKLPFNYRIYLVEIDQPFENWKFVGEWMRRFISLGNDRILKFVATGQYCKPELEQNPKSFFRYKHKIEIKNVLASYVTWLRYDRNKTYRMYFSHDEYLFGGNEGIECFTCIFKDNMFDKNSFIEWMSAHQPERIYIGKKNLAQ